MTNGDIETTNDGGSRAHASLAREGDFSACFPDGSVDLSTYDDVENALDLACVEPKSGDRWLTLPERVDLLAKMAPDPVGAPLEIRYRNWAGIVAERSIKPLYVWYGSTDWHPEPQWLLRGLDLEKNGAERDFALKDLNPAPEPFAFE